MSYDRKLDQRCPHFVIEEALFLDDDRRTIRPVRPISAADSVRVRFNGSFEVPPDGYHVAPRVLGTKRGPFSIAGGFTDTLSLDINQGAKIETVKVPATGSITATQLVSYLNKKVTSVKFFERNNRVGFQSAFSGDGASVLPRSDCTLFEVLGISRSKELRGQTRVPGWFLINDPTTLLDRPTRLVVFDTPLTSVQDFVEINYATVQPECRRCGGVGYENDWLYGSTGEVVQVRDEALLIQESIKMTLTENGSNPFHPWYGTQLVQQLGTKISNSGITQNLIVADITQSFNRWQNIKRQQEERVGQFVSDAEFPFKILSVDVYPSTNDPTMFFVNIRIMNRSSKGIEIERGVKIPAGFIGNTAEGIFREGLNGLVLSG